MSECVQLQLVVSTLGGQLSNLSYCGRYSILNIEFLEGHMLSVEQLALAFIVTAHLSDISV